MLDGSCGLQRRTGKPYMPLKEEHDGRYQMRDSHCDRREPAALLHREGDPRSPPSTQRNSNDRQRAHTATEGSCGSVAPERKAPSDAE